MTSFFSLDHTVIDDVFWRYFLVLENAGEFLNLRELLVDPGSVAA